MKKRFIFFILSSFALLLFLIYSNLVRKEVFSQLDFDTTVKLQDKIPLRLDPYFSMLSLIGDFEVILIVIVLIVFFASSKAKHDGSFTNRILSFIKTRIFRSPVIFLFALAHVIEIIGKTFLNHPPPPHLLLRTDLPFNFPSSYVQPGSSYPSGHSMRAVFLAIIMFGIVYKSQKLNLVSKALISSIIISFTFVMLISRVSLGEHWTTDVIGGSLLGLGMGIMSLIFL